MKKPTLILLSLALAFATSGHAQIITTSTTQWDANQTTQPADIYSGLATDTVTNQVIYGQISMANNAWSYNVLWNGNTVILTNDGSGVYQFGAAGINYSLAIVNNNNNSATLVFTWTTNGLSVRLHIPDGTSGNQTFVIYKNQPGKLFNIYGQQVDPKTGKPINQNSGGTSGGASGGSSGSGSGGGSTGTGGSGNGYEPENPNNPNNPNYDKYQVFDEALAQLNAEFAAKRKNIDDEYQPKIKELDEQLTKLESGCEIDSGDYSRAL